MVTVFSGLLIRRRKEAGFPTAYRFYHDNGGAAALKISYRNYLMLEQGRALPVISRLGRLLFALGLTPGSAQADELVVAWLRTMSGEETFRDILQPLLREERKNFGFSPLHGAMKMALSGRKHHITPDQLRVILTNRATNLCMVAMSNDTGLWPVEDIAKALGLKRSETAEAMKILAAAKLMKEVKKGVFRCPLAGGNVEYPFLNTLDQSFRLKLEKYNKDLIASGAVKSSYGCIIRADSEAFSGFFPVMGLNIATAQTYSVNKKSASSALFFVEGRIIKLRCF